MDRRRRRAGSAQLARLENHLNRAARPGAQNFLDLVSNTSQAAVSRYLTSQKREGLVRACACARRVRTGVLERRKFLGIGGQPFNGGVFMTS